MRPPAVATGPVLGRYLPVDLFNPSADAVFRQRGPDRIAGRAARVYEFSVEQSNSNWRLEVGGESYFTRLANGEFLLPARAVAQSCTPRSNLCTRNSSEFREYKVFGADSAIKYEP